MLSESTVIDNASRPVATVNRDRVM